MAEEKSTKGKTTIKRVIVFILFSFLMFNVFHVLIIGGAIEPSDGAGGRDGADGSSDLVLSAGSDLPPGATSDYWFILNMPFYDKTWWMLYREDELIAYELGKMEEVSFMVEKIFRPSLKIPAFASPGHYHLILMIDPGEFTDDLPWWLKINLFTWLLDTLLHLYPDIIIHRFDFTVAESSLWDNLFAPLIIYIAPQKFLIFDMSKPYCVMIPSALFFILAIILFIIFIKFIVPLWLHIPKAAKWDPNRYRKRVKKNEGNI